MIKPRMMRVVGLVAEMGRRGIHIGFYGKDRKKETTIKTKT
jgi:hypothetical protein